MHLAYITYEYPPDIQQGGIATYVAQVAQIMNDHKHQVEIFCGSQTRTISEEIEGILIHRIQVESPQDFMVKVLDKFVQRHQYQNFDMVESPEVNGNGYLIATKFPELNFVVRLHCPNFLLNKLNHSYLTFFQKLRYLLGALRRGRLDLGYWRKYKPLEDIDYQITNIATTIVSPTIEMRDEILKYWNLDSKKIEIIANPYLPSSELLTIPIETHTDTITFVGKLNIYKGMIALTEAIPKVLKRFPNYKFILIGADSNSHIQGVSMKMYMQNRLKNYLDKIEFVGEIPISKVNDYLAKTDICVFPSLWESSGYVCQEAMSAARGIVAGNRGGMKTLLRGNDTGILVNPMNINTISNSIIQLIENPNLRFDMGLKARERILREYGSERYYEAVFKILCQKIELRAD